MKRLCVILGVCLVIPLSQSLISFAAEKGKTPVKKKSTQVLMQQKLVHAQQILAGLVTENYAMIAKESENLMMVAKASSWHNPDSEDYQRYFGNFKESVAFLGESAKNKNHEGVAMGYIRLTLTCMQCHNFVREGRKR